MTHRHPIDPKQVEAAALRLIEIREMGKLVKSDIDEDLMMKTLGKCYDDKTLAFRVSQQHYRYLAEQLVSQRQIEKRLHAEIVRYRQALNRIAWPDQYPDSGNPLKIAQDVLLIRGKTILSKTQNARDA